MAKNKRKAVPSAAFRAIQQDSRWKKIPTLPPPPGGWDGAYLALSCRILDLDGPFGWSNITGEKLREVMTKLRDHESRKLSEIFRDAKHLNHAIDLDDLSSEAKKRLTELDLDDLDCVHTLRLSGSERIIGWRYENVYYVLWWDPEHRVCPSNLRHT